MSGCRRRWLPAVLWRHPRHKGSAVRAPSSNSFWSSTENAFACSLSTSIRADHRAVLGMHDGHDHFRKRAAKDGQIGGRPGSSGGSRAMSCARVGHDGYHFASHIVHAGPSMVSPGLALPGQVSWLVRSAPLFRRRLTESVSTLPERGSLSLLRI